MDFKWILNGFYSILKGFSMDFQWILNGFYSILKGFSMDFKWILNGSSFSVTWTAFSLALSEGPATWDNESCQDFFANVEYTNDYPPVN